MGSLFSLFRRGQERSFRSSQGSDQDALKGDGSFVTLEDMRRIQSLAKARLQQAEAFAQQPKISDFGEA